MMFIGELITAKVAFGIGLVNVGYHNEKPKMKLMNLQSNYRLIQKAISQILIQIYDPTFSVLLGHGRNDFIRSYINEYFEMSLKKELENN